MFYKQIALSVPSTATEETYGWLGQFPKLEEWLGPRIIKNLVAHSYAIKNRTFATAISVPRVSIEDDQYGVFTPVLEEMGRSAAEQPDELVFTPLKNGFATKGYDGEFFFDTDHPVTDDTNSTTLVGNMQAGALAPWFLLDCSRPIKPIVYQERLPYELAARDRKEDDNVFLNDEYQYGVRARSNAGYGLWQMAFASKSDLTAANYEAARTTMRNQRGAGRRPLNVMPDTLVVPPSLEGAALRLLNSEYGTGGVTNEWKGAAKLIVTPWVA